MCPIRFIVSATLPNSVQCDSFCVATLHRVGLGTGLGTSLKEETHQASNGLSGTAGLLLMKQASLSYNAGQGQAVQQVAPTYVQMLMLQYTAEQMIKQESGR